MPEHQPLDCRVAGVSEICYQTCPAINFAGLEQRVASAIHDLGLAEGMVSARRELVTRHAESEIATAEHVTRTAARHDGAGPWEPDFSQLPVNMPSRAGIVRENRQVCCGVNAVQIRNIGRGGNNFDGAILTKPTPET
jgi:hypothetical protein